MEFIPPALNQGVPFGQVNRVVASRQIQDDESYDFKGDYVHSEATRLYVRYSLGESDKIFPSIEENYARSAPYDNRNGVIGYTRVINPNVLLEFHFGYDRVDNRPTQAVGPGIGERDFHTELGLVNVNQFQPCKQPPWVNLTFRALHTQQLRDHAEQQLLLLDESRVGCRQTFVELRRSVHARAGHESDFQRDCRVVSVLRGSFRAIHSRTIC